MQTLLSYKKNIHSQNGEDGIIEQIFKIIGDGKRICCEFGAWDGIHLSNCRRLIVEGWSAAMIEADEKRYIELKKNYHDYPNVYIVNRLVDTRNNRIESICNDVGIYELDLLSIDIDGLDYEIFSSLHFHPRVICVEVNAGHCPESKMYVDMETASKNVGQSLMLFYEAALRMGYVLTAYTANAFFIRKDVWIGTTLPMLSPVEAYNEYLQFLDKQSKIWIYMVGKGLVPPFYQYNNPWLDRRALGVAWVEIFKLAKLIARKTGYRFYLQRLVRSFWMAIINRQGILV